MSIKEFKKFIQSETNYSASRVKKCGSMLKLLSEAGVTNYKELQRFIDVVEKESKEETYANILNTKLNTQVTDRTARDYMSSLRGLLNEFEESKTNIEKTIEPKNENKISFAEIIKLAARLEKNETDAELPEDIKNQISLLILQGIIDSAKNIIKNKESFH